MAIIAVTAAVFLALGLLSGFLSRTWLTAPMLALAAGAVLGPGIGVVPTSFENAGVLLLAQLTLALVLFVDATRIDVRLLRRNGQVPARMLLVGLPLAIGLGAVAGVGLLGLSFAAALVLACVLAPTDAALGQALLGDERVPLRVRQALNVESGLNDGLVVPFLTIALVVAEAETGTAGGLALEAARLVVGGAIVGGVTGGAVAWLVRRLDWHTLRAAPRQVGIAAVPLLAFAGASLVGGNGFVAAFVAGAVLGVVLEDAHEVVEFGEDAAELLSLLTFLVFGAVFLAPAAGAFSAMTVAYAVASLTVVRMAPVALGLVGLGLRPMTVGLLGWFGPRGLATVVFGLEVLELGESGELATGEELFGIAALVVVASVVLHGLSAKPLASTYAAGIERRRSTGHGEEMSEHRTAPDVPMRHRDD